MPCVANDDDVADKRNLHKQICLLTRHIAAKSFARAAHFLTSRAARALLSAFNHINGNIKSKINARRAAFLCESHALASPLFFFVSLFNYAPRMSTLGADN